MGGANDSGVFKELDATLALYVLGNGAESDSPYGADDISVYMEALEVLSAREIRTLMRKAGAP